VKKDARVGVAVFGAWIAAFVVACSSSSSKPPRIETSDSGLAPPIYGSDGSSGEGGHPDAQADTNPPPPFDAGTDTTPPPADTGVDTGFDAGPDALDAADG